MFFECEWIKLKTIKVQLEYYKMFESKFTYVSVGQKKKLEWKTKYFEKAANKNMAKKFESSN